ncbi:hypothetical protein ACTA71_007823 [Dictyostelium dimigraforme]
MNIDKLNYILYKKVFGNIVISNKIFKFVRYENDEDDEEEYYNEKINEFYKFYEIKKELKRSYDFTINELLSKKLYYLFDYLFNFYFKVVLVNRERYWKFITIFQLNDKKDFKSILSYKQLGYDRFLEIYNHSKFQFKRFKKTVLKSVAKSGNSKIYKFLLKEEIYNYNRKYYSDPTHFQSIFIKSSFIDCNNNQEIFDNEIKFNNFNFSFIQALDLLKYSLNKNNLVYLKYLVNYLIDREVDLKKNKKPFPLSGVSENLVNALICFSFCNSSLYLAKIIIDSDYLSNKFNGNYPLAHIKNFTKVLDFEILKFYWNSKRNQFKMNGLLLNSSTIGHSFLEIKNFNFNLINYNFNDIKILISRFYYVPTFEEFKFLINNNNIEFKKLNWDLIFLKITKQLFDCDYLKLVLDFIKNESTLNNTIVLKSINFDSKLSIVQFLFNNFEKYKSIEFTNFSGYFYEYSDLFFNDLNSLDLFLKKTKHHTLNLYNLILKTSIIKNNSIIFNHLINNFKLYSEKEPSYKDFFRYIGKSENQGYQGLIIFKTLINQPGDSINLLGYYNIHFIRNSRLNCFNQHFLIGNPLIYHYLFLKHFENRYFFYLDDLNFLKLFFKPLSSKSSSTSLSKSSGKQQNNNNSNENEYKKHIFKIFNNFNNIKESLLNYLVLDCDLKPSTLNFDSKLLEYVFGKNNYGEISKRLCFFIENDPDWVGDNILKIIYNSCKFRDLFYVNLILLNRNYSKEIKHHLLIHFIFNSIIKLNDQIGLNGTGINGSDNIDDDDRYYYDKDDFWFSKLKVNENSFNESLNLYNFEICKLVNQIENTNQINKFNLNIQSLEISKIKNQFILTIISLLYHHFKSISTKENILDNKLQIKFF